MCQSCRNEHVFFLFDWPSDLCERARRYCLADVLSFAQDAFQAPVHHLADEITLTASGARGLALLLGAVEQSLRFDVAQITPKRQEG